MSISQAVYLIKFKPLLESKDRNLLVFEEMSVLLVACILPCFTDMFEDDDMKWNLGWLVIAIIFANFFINFIIILYSFCKTLKGPCQRLK